MNLIPVEIGTKLGYEDYHGEVYMDSHVMVAGWNYDKKQSLYIGSISPEFGVIKRFYAPSVSQLIHKISNYLDKNPLQPKT